MSITADTLFHATKVPLVNWLWAIWLATSGKGCNSALRLSKQIGVSWVITLNVLNKISTATAHRDRICRLQQLIEFEDTYVSGKCAGK